VKVTVLFTKVMQLVELLMPPMPVEPLAIVSVQAGAKVIVVTSTLVLLMCVGTGALFVSVLFGCRSVILTVEEAPVHDDSVLTQDDTLVGQSVISLGIIV
jgi:hypothetical protein